MKNSADKDSMAVELIEDDMLTLFDPAKPSVHLIASASKAGRPGDPLEAFHEALDIDILLRLFRAPHVGW